MIKGYEFQFGFQNHNLLVIKIINNKKEIEKPQIKYSERQ